MTPRTFILIAVVVLATCVLNVDGWYKLHDKYGLPNRNFALVPAAKLANTNGFFKQIRAAYNGELLFTADDYLSAGIKRISLPRGLVESNPFPRSGFCAPPVGFNTDKNGDLWVSHYQNSIWYDTCAATSGYGTYYQWSPGYVYKYQAISRYNSAGTLQQNYNMPIDVAWHMMQFTNDKNEDLFFIRGGNFPFTYSGYPCMLRIASDFSYFCYAEQNGNWNSIAANKDHWIMTHNAESRYWRQDLGQQYGQYTWFTNETQQVNTISSTMWDDLTTIDGLSTGHVSWNTNEGNIWVHERMFSNLPDTGNTQVTRDREENTYVANGNAVYRVQRLPDVLANAPRGGVTAFSNVRGLLYDAATNQTFAADNLYGIRRMAGTTDTVTSTTWADATDTRPTSIGSITRDNRNPLITTRFLAATNAAPAFTAIEGQSLSLTGVYVTAFNGSTGALIQQYRNPSPYFNGIRQTAMSPDGQLMMLITYTMANYAAGLARLNLATGQLTGFFGFFSDITQIPNYGPYVQDSVDPGTPFYLGLSNGASAGVPIQLTNIQGFAYDRAGTLYVSNANEIYLLESVTTPTTWNYESRTLTPTNKPPTMGLLSRMVSKLWDTPTKLAFDLHDNLIILEAAGALWSLNPQGLRALLMPVPSSGITRSFAVNPSLPNAFFYTTGTSKQLQSLSLQGPTSRGKFDGERYLLHQVDVKNANMDPWFHWSSYGWYEQRTIYLKTHDGVPGGFGVFDHSAYLAEYQNRAPITDSQQVQDTRYHYIAVGYGLTYDAFVTTAIPNVGVGWNVPSTTPQYQNAY